MDVGSIFGVLTGGGNVKIEIRVNPPQSGPCVVLDHMPSWRLHKNPFWRVKHPAGDRFTLSSSSLSSPSPSSLSNLPQQQHFSQSNHLQQHLQQQQQPYSVPQQQGGGMDMMDAPSLVAEQQRNPLAPPPPPPYASSSSQGQTIMTMPNTNPNMMNPYNSASSPGSSFAASSSSQQQQQHPYPTNMYSPQPAQQQQQPPQYNKDVLYAFEASQDICGSVILRLPTSSGSTNKKFEHLGIKAQFIGRIDMSMGGMHEGRPHYDFTSLSKELAPPGTLYQSETILPFHFKNMDKELESYRGRNVGVRYIIKVVMERKFLPPLTKEYEVWIQVLGQAPPLDEIIKMEVGIEDCLHIEFEYDRRHYHLTDTIRGQIHFLLVHIKIKYMELAVLRRETSGEGVAAAAAAAEGTGSRLPAGNNNVDANNICTETQTLVKYEIMDSAPIKGVVIPVKLPLSGIPADLTPTYTAVNNRFSVRYFLNLVLVDEDDRRYFKQQEIVLWRKTLG